jgi:hypothetical protein
VTDYISLLGSNFYKSLISAYFGTSCSSQPFISV